MAESIGAVIIDVKSDISYLVHGMKKAEGVVEQSAKIMTTALAMVATAAGTVSLKSFIDETAKSTVEQKAFAEQLSVSVETLTKYEFIASKAHVTTDQLRDAFKDAGTKVTEFQREGKSAKEAFKALGISQDFAKKNMISTEKSMEILLQRLAKFPDGMQKATIAQEIFGDEGSHIIRVANLGADAIKRYTEIAQKGNITTSEAFAAKSATYLDAQQTLKALEGGWASAVIEESQFLEMGTSMYEQLSSSIMDWTEDVQNGNSEFVDGLHTITNGVNASFPAMIEIGGVLGRSMYAIGESVVTVGGVVLDLVGDLLGFEEQTNQNITTLGHFSGIAMGASMAIENFANLMKFSANGFEIFGISIETYAISRLNSLQATFYESMATISDFLSLIDDDFASDAEEYKRKAIRYDNEMMNSLSTGNAKLNELMAERTEIISKMHSSEMIEAQMKKTAYAVSVRQREGMKEVKAPPAPDYDKQGKASVKALEASMKALEDAEKKTKSLEQAKAKLAKETEKANKEAIRAEEQRIKALVAFEDVYKKTTMSRFDYEVEQLEKEKVKYIELQADKREIDEWYSIEFQKLLDERIKKEDAELQKKVDKYKEIYEENMKIAVEANRDELESIEKKIEAEKELAKVQKDRLANFVEDLLHTKSISKSFENYAKDLENKSFFDFSDALADTVVEGFDKGFQNLDYSNLDESFGVAIGAYAQAQIVAHNQDSSRQRDGTAIGGGIGTVVGSYLGGAVGGSIGGAVGSAIGGSIAGGKRDYYVVVDDGTLASMRRTSGGMFHSSHVKQLDEETLQLRNNFELVFDSYTNLLKNLSGATFDFALANGRYDTDEVDSLMLDSFFSKWVGLVDNTTKIDALTPDSNKEMMELLRVNPNFPDDLAILEAEQEAFNAKYTENELELLRQKKETIQVAWEEYATQTEQSVQQAMGTILDSLKSKSIEISEYNLGDDEATIYRLRKERAREHELELEAILGAGDVTLQNYQLLYASAKESAELTPQMAQNWLDLGTTLLSVDANAKSAKNALDSIFQSYLKDVSTLYNAYDSQQGIIDSYQQQELAYQESIRQAQEQSTQNYLDNLKKIESETEKMFDSAIKSFDSAIANIRGTGQSDSQSMFSSLVGFNSAEARYRSLLEQDSVDANVLQDAYQELIGFANDIDSNDLTQQGLRESLISALEYDRSILETTDTVAKVEVVADSSASSSNIYNSNMQIAGHTAEQRRQNEEALALQRLFNRALELDHTTSRASYGQLIAFANAENITSVRQLAELEGIFSDGLVNTRELQDLKFSSEAQQRHLADMLGIDFSLDSTLRNLNFGGSASGGGHSGEATYIQDNTIGYRPDGSVYVPAQHINYETATLDYNSTAGSYTQTTGRGEVSIVCPSGTSNINGSCVSDSLITHTIVGGVSAWSSYDGGGFTGAGNRTGGVDGKGGKISILHPNEFVMDFQKQGITVKHNSNFDELVRVQKDTLKELIEIKKENKELNLKVSNLIFENSKLQKTMEEGLA